MSFSLTNIEKQDAFVPYQEFMRYRNKEKNDIDVSVCWVMAITHLMTLCKTMQLNIEASESFIA